MGKPKPRVSFEVRYWVQPNDHFEDPRVYQVLIGEEWRFIDPDRNIVAQTHNMRGYRALTVFGAIIFQVFFH